MATTQTQQPRIQFQTVGNQKKGTSRVQWSDGYGQSWHEPQDVPRDVARAWQRIAQKA